MSGKSTEKTEIIYFVELIVYILFKAVKKRTVVKKKICSTFLKFKKVLWLLLSIINYVRRKIKRFNNL